MHRVHDFVAAFDIQNVATQPRIITPGRTVYLTIRAVSRQYRFLPTQDVVDSINYIFWHCVENFERSAHEMTWMSNHGHLCLTDNKGILPRFVGKMNSLISRQLNALRAEKGTNFEKGYSDIEIVSDDSLVNLCAYTLANPCAADLVSSAGAWKGVTTYHLDYNRPFIVKRPNCGMWKDGGNWLFKMPRKYSTRLRGVSKSSEQDGASKKRKKKSKLPEEVVATLVRPSEEALRLKIRLERKVCERRAILLREEQGRGVLGMRKVMQLRWNDAPSSVESVFKEKPRIAASDEVARVDHRGRIAACNEQYKAVLAVFVTEGRDKAVFPAGTWKMRVQFNAKCAGVSQE